MHETTVLYTAASQGVSHRCVTPMWFADGSGYVSTNSFSSPMAIWSRPQRPEVGGLRARRQGEALRFGASISYPLKRSRGWDTGPSVTGRYGSATHVLARPTQGQTACPRPPVLRINLFTVRAVRKDMVNPRIGRIGRVVRIAWNRHYLGPLPGAGIAASLRCCLLSLNR